MSDVRKFFVDDLPSELGRYEFPEDISRHIKVLRLSVGEGCELFDQEGRRAQVYIERIGADGVLCVVKNFMSKTVVERPMVLVLGLPKTGQLDNAIRMATELGVTEIRLAYTERSVPAWDKDRAMKKLGRLQRIVQQAAEQSERGDVPKLTEPVALSDAIVVDDESFKVAFVVRGADELPVFSEHVHRQIVLLIGPEGGFTAAEHELLAAEGYDCVHLGRTVLRVETAVASVLALAAFG